MVQALTCSEFQEITYIHVALMDIFCYPLNIRSHILMGQPSRVLTLLNSFRLITCSYVTLLCYRYLLLWFLVSAGSDDCQVNQLKQKLSLTVLASGASGTSEKYLRAFHR